MIFLSPAKINLSLYITGKDKKDGYHFLNSIVDPVSLYDFLDISVIEKQKIILIDKFKKLKINYKKNLIYKAAKLLQKKYNVKKGAVIKFYKYIPDGAGLGGGSSNAATTLKALNKLWNLKISIKNLEKIASQIGSDIPFFIKSKYARIKNKGEKINILKRKRIYWYVIVIPKYCKINTKFAYQWFDEDFVLTKKTTYYKILNNDLELPVLKRIKLLKNIKDKIIKIADNEKNVSMSGSGSAFFSLCETKKRAKIIFMKLKRNFKNCYVFLAHSI